MTKPDYTDIVVVLDRSGSMGAIKTDMEGGFNAFITKQKALPGICKVSLYQFDDQYEQVYQGLDIHSVPNLVLTPRNMTALYDATAKTIISTGERYKAMPEWDRPGKVIFMVITDGNENASKEFPREQGGAAKIKEMIKHQEQNYNWVFVYIGSDPTTQVEAMNLGFTKNNVQYSSNSVGTRALWSAVDDSVGAYRGMVSATMDSFEISANVRTDDDPLKPVAGSINLPKATLTSDPVRVPSFDGGDRK